MRNPSRQAWRWFAGCAGALALAALVLGVFRAGPGGSPASTGARGEVVARGPASGPSRSPGLPPTAGVPSLAQPALSLKGAAVPRSPGALSESDRQQASRELTARLTREYRADRTGRQPLRGQARGVGTRVLNPRHQEVVDALLARLGPDAGLAMDHFSGALRYLRGDLRLLVEHSAAYQDARRRRDHGAMASELIGALREVMALRGSEVALVPERVQDDELGMVHVALRQTCRGIPVWGAVVRAHFDAFGDPVEVSGVYAPVASLLPAPADPVSEAEAVVRAKQALGMSDDGLSPVVVTRMVYWNIDQPASECHRVDLEPRLGSEMQVFVALADGRVVHQYNTVPGGAVTGTAPDLAGQSTQVRAWEQSGTNYAVDTTFAMYQGADPLQYENTKGGLYIGDLRNTENLTDIYYVTSANVNAWDASAVSLQKALRQSIEYFINTHGRQSFDAQGHSVLGVVHMGTNYLNAFWSPNHQKLFFGDGDGRTFREFPRALDIVGHEFAHAVTSYTANLKYENQSGAMNEHFSDFFGVMIDRQDWLMGEDCAVGKIAGRDLQNPGNPQVLSPLPAHMRDFRYLPNTQDGDWGGVHINCGILNRMCYVLAAEYTRDAEPGIGKEKTERILYRALGQYLNELSQFVDYRRAAVSAATDLYGADSLEVAAVRGAFDSVGVTEDSGGGTPDPTPGPTPTGSEFTLFCAADPSWYSWYGTYRYGLSIHTPAGGGSWLSGQYVMRTKPAVSGDGTFALFVNDTGGLFMTDGTTEERWTPDGTVRTLAMSKDVRYLAYTTTAFDSVIYVIDAGSSSETAVPLQVPQPDGTVVSLTFADIMSFNFQGNWLAFDAIARTNVGGGEADTWGVYGLRLTDYALVQMLPCSAQEQFGNPTFSNTGSAHLLADYVLTSGTETQYGLVSLDFWNNGAGMLVPSLPEAAEGSCSGNDTKAVWRTVDGTTGYSLMQGTFAAGKLALSGSPSVLFDWGLLDLAYPVGASDGGYQAAPGTIQVSVPEVNFAATPVGSTVEQSLTIQNVGAGDLEVTSVTLTGGQTADFGHDGHAGVLSPGAQTTVRVGFRPQATGARQTTLRIASADTAHAQVDVVLRGNGLADTVRPTVAGRVPAPSTTVRGPNILVEVTFSELVTGIEAADLVLSGSAAVGATVGTPQDLTGGKWRFPVTGLADGALTLNLAPTLGSIQDLQGNNLDPSPTTWGCTVGTPAGDGVVTYRAVIVGISDFQGTANDLNYCDDDARDIRDALLAGTNWQAANITLLLDTAATKQGIRTAVENLAAAADEDDFCLLFYSSHGTTDTDRVPLDETDGYDEFLCTYEFANISDDEWSTWISALPTRNYVFIADTCFSGGHVRGGETKGLGSYRPMAGDGFAADLVEEARTRDLDDLGWGAVMTACADNETSQESASIANGVFAYYVVEGITGAHAADTNGNGWVSLEEAYAYASPKATQMNTGQHAQFYDGHPGEIEFLCFRASETVATPEFSPPSGTAIPVGGLSVTITCGTAAAEIWYTTDGTNPVQNQPGSTRYTAPIALAVTTTLKARAYKAGMDPSPIATATYTATAAGPAITGLAPNHGPAAGGTSVVISGSGFTGATAVRFGGTNAAAFAVNSATQITATSPAGTAGVTVDVTVTTAEGTSANTAADDFAYDAVGPAVTGLNPNHGPAAGGSIVIVTGSGFTGATAVRFGGTNATSFTVISATQIAATSPAGTAGATVDVSVTTAAGTSANTAADDFTYDAVAPTVTGLDPNHGPAAGGTGVVISGSGFTGATAVRFGGTNATAFTVDSATQITATSPPGTAGTTVDVSVTNVAGTSANTAADDFSYDAVVAGPSVTGLNPNHGPAAGGTSVIISGSGFTGITAVRFGGTNATSFAVVSATMIAAASPAGTAGTTVDVTVTTAEGTSANTAADDFSYDAVGAGPSVTGLNPDHGPAAGGTSVVISGSGFTGATAVRFGGSNATAFTVNSATQITATSPVGTAGATVSVSVTTAAGTSANTAADDFAYDPAPATHTVTFVPGVGGQIVGSNPQTVAHGGNCTAVTAQAAYGYVFTQWDDGVLTATRTVTNVQADQVHTASFRAANTVPPPETTGRFAAVTDAVGVNAGKALWDLSGDYPMTVAGHPLVMHLIHDTKGKLTGTATYTVAKATVVNLPVKGSVKGSAGAVVVSIALKGADPTKAVSVALSFRLTVNAGARELTGPLTGSVIINGTNALAPTEVHLPVPAPMDGTWTLQFDLARGTKGITGTAELVLSNAVDYDYVVRGKVVGQTAVVSLAATATDPAAKGIKIKATVVPLEGGWAGLQSFSGKGYGQTLAW